MNVVTGAFGYTGKYIARGLLAMGQEVRTLTGHLGNDPFGGRVTAFALDFGDPAGLEEGLYGADTLYNTYWIRFPRREVTFDTAVANTAKLIRAAEKAGVRRLVHISITNPSEDSQLPYFKGKAIVERMIRKSGLTYAIIRPTVIFGLEDILVNNIAWLLRHSPVFAIMGSGEYRIQPAFVEDIAEIAVDAGQGEENIVMDAVGTETFTFRELVRLIKRTIGSNSRIMHVRPLTAYFLSKIVGFAVRDVVLTWDEVQGLRSNLLISNDPPRCRTRFSTWLADNRELVGVKYASELRRHYI